MSKVSSKITVVDIECTCWKEPNRNAQMEIIEFGICVFDGLTGEIERKSSHIVRPVLLDISNFCARLTGLTREQLMREGRPLRDVLNHIRKAYPVRTGTWAGWGSGDRDHVVRETILKGIENPFSNDYLDIGLLYQLYARSPRRINLEEAIQQLGMTFQGRPHSGADDAWNTARVLRGVMNWEQKPMLARD